MPIKKGPASLNRLLNRDKSLKALISRSGDHEQLLVSVRTRLPDPLCDHCVAAIQSNGTLTLFVDSPTWASRLRFLQHQLKADLAPMGITFHHFKVKVFHAGGSPSRHKLRQADLSKDNAEIISQCASSIADQELSEALIRLARHNKGGAD